MGEMLALSQDCVDCRAGNVTVWENDWQGNVGSTEGGDRRTVPMTASGGTGGSGAAGSARAELEAATSCARSRCPSGAVETTPSLDSVAADAAAMDEV
jgi:hypothetical protein